MGVNTDYAAAASSPAGAELGLEKEKGESNLSLCIAGARHRNKWRQLANNHNCRYYKTNNSAVAVRCSLSRPGTTTWRLSLSALEASTQLLPRKRTGRRSCSVRQEVRAR
jgi:hypothetical protein